MRRHALGLERRERAVHRFLQLFEEVDRGGGLRGARERRRLDDEAPAVASLVWVGPGFDTLCRVRLQPVLLTTYSDNPAGTGTESCARRSLRSRRSAPRPA